MSHQPINSFRFIMETAPIFVTTAIIFMLIGVALSLYINKHPLCKDNRWSITH